MTAQITIDERFFEIAGAQSSRYHRLWTIAKECIQNSQDAKASTITFEVEGSWVTVTDNGPGMGSTGGIANFLTIGASAKNQNGSATGFFSTAKVRICFIHKDWWIRTNSEYLSKSMLNSESIKTMEQPFNGCQISIQSKDGDWDVDQIADYVGLCNPAIRVKLGSSLLRSSYRRGQLKANYPWADIYVNRGQKALLGVLIVRVNGLAMFTRHLPNVRAQVTVELDPAMSHRVLQENREDLAWSAKDSNGLTFYPSSELNHFVNGLIVNPSSAKPKSKTVLEFVKGLVQAVEMPKARFGTDEVSSTMQHQTATVTVRNAPQPVTFGQLADGLLEGTIEQTAGQVDLRVRRGADGTTFLVDWVTGKLYDESDPLPVDVEFAVEAEPIEVKLILPRATEFELIFPYDYVIKHESKKPRPHTKHARVLAAWKDLCEKVAEIAGITSEFGFGLCVDQEARAEFVETDWGDYLLVDYREFKATGSQLGQTLKMVKLACHELTHARGYSDHDEAFMVAESTLFYNCVENHLTGLRECTKGLTIYSRGYGQN